ncbi:MAG: response regulator [Chloroflexota bacterium]
MDYTALTIDDDASARNLFSIILKRVGFEVLTAEDADDALAQVADITPDVILTDISLPGMDGIDLTAELRRREEFAHVPIIVLSAFHEDKVVNRAMDAGADAFFEKPLKPTHLRETLEELINARRA